jgi:hypothetical protein
VNIRFYDRDLPNLKPGTEILLGDYKGKFIGMVKDLISCGVDKRDRYKLNPSPDSGVAIVDESMAISTYWNKNGKRRDNWFTFHTWEMEEKETKIVRRKLRADEVIPGKNVLLARRGEYIPVTIVGYGTNVLSSVSPSPINIPYEWIIVDGVGTPYKTLIDTNGNEQKLWWDTEIHYLEIEEEVEV